MWGGWGADWPSASTDIPPLFDSRVNLTPASNGQDYGYYQNPAINQAIDAAAAAEAAASSAAAEEMNTRRNLPRPDMPDALEILSGLKEGEQVALPIGVAGEQAS